MNDSDKLRGVEPNGCDAERASDTGDTLTAEKKAWDKLDCDAPDCEAVLPPGATDDTLEDEKQADRSDSEEPAWEDEPLAEADCDARACDLRVRSRSRRL